MAHLNVSILFGKLTYGLVLCLACNAHLKIKNKITMESRKNMSFSMVSFILRSSSHYIGDFYYYFTIY